MNFGLFSHAEHCMSSGSKSFDAASRLFNKDTRRSTLMLYTWCRYCDDVIDSQDLGGKCLINPLENKINKLNFLKKMTNDVYLGIPIEVPAFSALQEVVIKHQIPLSQALEHLEGFAMDVRGVKYKSLNDTLDYCYHVAGVVGLMMARIMGVKEPLVLDRACDLGIAFQLTNIARDVIDDAKIGRCYLPLDWLEQEGLEPTMASLTARENRIALSHVANRILTVAESYYASALMGLRYLPIRSAWAIASAYKCYHKIGVKVQRAGKEAWDHRQHTSHLEKLSLLFSGGILALSLRNTNIIPRSSSLWQRPK
ncbi:phytoene/squalene synthase family protein [Xenorhabdus sp. KJ12.1]|uniref:phytoene/squalene synthase family protein n=1 Tax=Xenorhabdus sp. KJ12.1 TaxID=1851571 RepID=UPI000C044D77|nr:phytoene/squalene synthase family protein [Xenorhabdus sp. KJ12.1]PHM67330.1 All-trans-phytoene synthase/15-cis-phytoene synthase [Xenorhabdus sp. KJ12.1]